MSLRISQFGHFIAMAVVAQFKHIACHGSNIWAKYCHSMVNIEFIGPYDSRSCPVPVM